MALLTVTEAFADFRSGYPVVYTPGMLVDERDPVIKGREAHFIVAEHAVRPSAETATAAPNERRTRGRAAKKATKKAPAKKAPAPQTPKTDAPPAGDAGESTEVL